jgi:hypothetical protein
MKILLGDFNAKVGREDIFKLTIGNESLHEISINAIPGKKKCCGSWTESTQPREYNWGVTW